MERVLETINRMVWGIPLLCVIGGAGVVFTIVTKFAQFRLFPTALRAFFGQFKKKDETNGISSFRALCTALAATVGTGNLAGVAGAIAIGGPGAVFWMWILAILGMATKFVEVVLSVRYRTRNGSGELVGGPMYMIREGLGNKWHWMAGVYCFLGVVASFGVGNATQINTAISSMEGVAEIYGVGFTPLARGVIGVVLGVVIAMILSGGARRIGMITEMLIPFLSAGYILLSVYVLLLRADALPRAFCKIFSGAFSPGAVTGGVIGSMLTTLRVGASRGTFTNEAGMGTASIAHAAANVSHPVEQGLMGIIEVFLDTIIICTMTALVILCSGVPIPYGSDVGVALTTDAFATVVGDWSRVAISFALCCLALATILGWGLYGVRCVQFLFGDSASKRFVVLQAVAAVFGAVLQTGTVWLLSDVVNGLMAIPNLIALLMLMPDLKECIRSYKLPFSERKKA